MTRQQAISLAERAKDSRGQHLTLKWLKGGKLTPLQAIQAKCFDCMNRYVDGRIDCQIPVCPLYPWMPYKGDQENQTEAPESIPQPSMGCFSTVGQPEIQK